jgi:hypothetical protein
MRSTRTALLVLYLGLAACGGSAGDVGPDVNGGADANLGADSAPDAGAGTRADAGVARAPDAGVPDDVRAACRAAWERAERERAPEDRRGNPFPMLADDAENWDLAREVLGVPVELLPTDYAQFTTQSGAGPVDCQVPVRWRATALTLEIEVPEPLRAPFDTTMTVAEIGARGQGGLYIDFTGTVAKPYFVLLHWFLRPAPLPAQLEQASREAFRVAPEQKLALVGLADTIGDERYPVRAIAFSADGSFADLAMWAIASREVRDGREGAVFVPRRPVPGGATIAELVRPLWAHAHLGELRPWNAVHNRRAACSSRLAPDFGNDCVSLVPRLVHDAWARGGPLHIRLVITTDAGPVLITTRLDPDGAIAPPSFEPIFDLAAIGLPTWPEMEALSLLDYH